MRLAALTAAGWADQRKMRLTSLDHWTTNLFLPVGRDVILHSGIKKKEHTHAHKRSHSVFCAIFKGHCVG